MNLFSDFLYSIFHWILNLFPDWQVEMINFPELLDSILGICNYLLPMDTIGVLFILSMILTSTRLVLAIIFGLKRIFSL